MLLHAPTIRHVLDAMQAMVLSAEEPSQSALRKAFLSLNMIFSVELESLPVPEMLEKEKDEDLLVRVAAYFGCRVRSLIIHDRHKAAAGARHVAAWLLRRRERSFPEIGRLLQRDHTTIMSACNKVEAEIRKGSKLGKDALALAAQDVQEAAS